MLGIRQSEKRAKRPVFSQAMTSPPMMDASYFSPRICNSAEKSGWETTSPPSPTHQLANTRNTWVSDFRCGPGSRERGQKAKGKFHKSDSKKKASQSKVVCTKLRAPLRRGVKPNMKTSERNVTSEPQTKMNLLGNLLSVYTFY